MNNNRGKGIWLTFLLLISSLLVNAGDFPPWDVPADAQANKNPNAKNKESIEAGRNIYNMQCKACHGELGNGQGALKAANFTTSEFQSQSDGAIHYKLITGRTTMPSFKSLPDAEAWNVIHFIRTFGDGASKVAKRNAEIQFKVEEKGDRKLLLAIVKEKSAGGSLIPAANVTIGFYAKRWFGNLPIGKSAVKTNENGLASIEFRDEIPGDTARMLHFIARIDDSDFNPAEAGEAAKWGIALPPNTWDSDRELFKTNAHVPFWLLFTFFGLIGSVFAGVGYVALLAWKIKKAGN
jgi:mono/diheme cytochrome c family protein